MVGLENWLTCSSAQAILSRGDVATRLLQKLEIVLEQVGHGAGAYYRIRNY